VDRYRRRVVVLLAFECNRCDVKLQETTSHGSGIVICYNTELRIVTVFPATSCANIILIPVPKPQLAYADHQWDDALGDYGMFSIIEQIINGRYDLIHPFD
jgi:hypothetical protein